MKLFKFLSLGCWLCWFAAPGLQGVNAPAGTRHPLSLQAPADYSTRAPTNSSEVAWSQTLSYAGATYMAVHFTKFDLGPRDYLKVSDLNGGQSYILRGRGKMQRGNFWSQHVKGDAMRMELVIVGSDRGQGFQIEEYATGATASPTHRAPKSICGFDDKQNALCFSGLPMYEKGRAVARLLIHRLDGDYLGTGFLVSSNNHLLSNEHVITSANDAANTDYEFMAEAPDCYAQNCQLCYPGIVFSGAEFIQNSYDLDYALVRINSGDPAASYGYLQIDPRPPFVGEQIYIPQYPDGRAKEFAYYSSEFADAGGLCRIQSLTQFGCQGGSSDVGYYADTEGGSSGSPVISALNNQVIALHHCSGCLNTGIPIKLVWAEIACFIQPPAVASSEWLAPAAGGRTIVNVTAASGCLWSVQNPCPDWLTVTPLSGIGNGSVSVSAKVNTNCSTQVCSLIVAGYNFNVSQAGGVAHFSINSRNWNPPANGETITVNVTTGDGCSWLVNNPYSDWLTILPLGGTGSGPVTLSASINPDCVTRTAPNLTLAGQHLAINQLGQQIVSFSAAIYTNSEAVPTATITVRRCGPTTTTNSVTFATADGTGAAPADYRATNGTLRFGLGEVSKTFTVGVVNDTLDRPDKTVNLTISEPTGGALLGAQADAVLRIVNDDHGGVLRFGLASYTVAEGAGHALITVLRTGGLASGVTVDYATSDGSASASLDYTNIYGTLAFNANETSKTILVPIVNDTIAEPNATVFLTLSNPTGGAQLGTPATAVLTIIDDDTAGLINFSAAHYSISETATVATITVTRSGGLASGVTVDYGTMDGSATAGLKYLGTSGTLSFGAGELTKSFPVNVLDNNVADGNETVLLALSNPAGGARLGAISNAVLTIVDNEVGLQFSRAIYTNLEGTAAPLLNVVRTGPALRTVTVAYFTQDGSASSNSHYQAKSGMLTFGPGVTSQNISLIVTNDTIVEGDETLMVCLTNPGGGALLGTLTNATLWIVDDDHGGVIGFSATNYMVAEASPSAAITIVRSGGLASGVTVDFTTTDGTATQGLDYSNSTRTVSFGANEISKTVLVPIRNDTLHELNETVLLALSNPTGGGSLGARTNAILTILDDDIAGLINFSAAHYSISETATVATITVIRSGGLASGVTVDYGTTDGSATAGLKYLSNSGTLSFGAGELTKSFPVTVLDNNVADGNQTVLLALSNPTGGGKLGAISNAVLTIVDNEVGLQFSKTTYTNLQGTAAALLSVVRTGPALRTVTVAYFTQDGSASSNSDYQVKSGILTFGPGVLSQNISLILSNNTQVEGNEMLMVGLANPGGGALLGTLTNATLWIVDNRSGGVISTNPSPRLILNSARAMTNGIFAFKFTGQQGSRYVIQSSTNLHSWQNMATNIMTGDGLTFMDGNSRNSSQHFYRAKLAP